MIQLRFYAKRTVTLYVAEPGVAMSRDAARKSTYATSRCRQNQKVVQKVKNK
jgi:hypothetical protein